MFKRRPHPSRRQCKNLIPHLYSGDPPVSLRLGHGSALLVHRTNIHYLAAASLPTGEGICLFYIQRRRCRGSAEINNMYQTYAAETDEVVSATSLSVSSADTSPAGRGLVRADSVITREEFCFDVVILRRYSNSRRANGKTDNSKNAPERGFSRERLRFALLWWHRFYPTFPH